MYTAAIITIVSAIVLILAVILRDRTNERDSARKEVSDLKKYKAEKEAYLMPVTQENIKDFLFDTPVDAKILDDKTMTVDDGDVFIFDTERLPMLHIKTGISIDASYEKGFIEASASLVQNEVVMVETTVTEGKFVEFHISCCETCIGHLRESWQWYKNIMAHSKEVFIQGYNHLHDNAMNENYMKKDSPEAQMQRVAEQMIANKKEEAEQNARNQKSGRHCLS